MAEEETFLSRIAIKRFGYPDDYSKAIEFLVSDQSDYITGHTLEVSGGVSGRMRVDSLDFPTLKQQKPGWLRAFVVIGIK